MSRLDQLYRRLLLTKFFTKGWGKPDNLKRLFDFRKIISNRELCKHLVSSNYPIYIDKEYPDSECRILEGHFTSPFVEHLPGVMPKEVQIARFQMILPNQWKSNKHKPVCIHLAGTGDHYFWRRRLLMAKPLLKESGIASILLENPYYGSRKPKGQLRSSLHNVSDLFVMGGALIMESLVLLHWCKNQGYGPLGLTGISMGGHMASLAASNWHEPISLVPCLSWSTASVVFTQGVMSGAIPWKTLETQFFENSIYQTEISRLIVSPEMAFNEGVDNSYTMGQQFVKDFSRHFPQMQEMHQNILDTHPPHSPPLIPSLHQGRGHDHGALMQASVGPISPPPAVAVSTGPHQDSSSSAAKSKTPLTLQHAFSKSQISRPTQKKDFSHPPSAEGVLPKTGAITSRPDSASTDSVLSSRTGEGHSDEGSLSSESTSLKSKANSSSEPKLTKGDTLSRKGSLSDSEAALMDLERVGSKVSSLSGSAVPVPVPTVVLPLQKEAVNFMIGVMDECTHLGNFSIPVDPSLVIIVAAQEDAYIPRHGVLPLDHLWPGAEVRYLENRGHIAAFLLHNNVFRKAITDSFQRQMKKYHNS